MKGDNAAHMDGNVVEILKIGGIRIINWLLRIFNRCISLVLYLRIGKQRVSFLYIKGKLTEETVQIMEE